MKKKVTFSILILGLFSVITILIAQPMGGGHFNRIDSNNDGKITKTEWLTHHTELFDKIDSDKDGSLSSSEVEQNRPGRRHRRR
jgi:hypothetical protein